MRKPNASQVEKGYIKNQVTYQKKGLLYLASETCNQTQDKGDTEWVPLKGPASCFTSRVDNIQMVAVPSVPCVLVLAQGGGIPRNDSGLEESYLEWRKTAVLSSKLSEDPQSA